MSNAARTIASVLVVGFVLVACYYWWPGAKHQSDLNDDATQINEMVDTYLKLPPSQKTSEKKSEILRAIDGFERKNQSQVGKGRYGTNPALWRAKLDNIQ